MSGESFNNEAGVVFGSPQLPQRFWDKVQLLDNGCWNWTAAKVNKEGHGYYYHEGKPQLIHRVTYRIFIGEPGEVLHHKCENTGCANPLHLESTVHKEHVYFGDGPSALNVRKTHCPRGHEYNEANTKYEGGTRRENKARRCSICQKKRRRLRTLRYKSVLTQDQQIERDELEVWLAGP